MLPPDDAIPLSEAAAKLKRKLPEYTLRAWITRGCFRRFLPAVKLGKLWLVRMADVEAFVTELQKLR